MATDYFSTLGVPVPAANLRLPQAQELAAVLTRPGGYPFCRLTECRQIHGDPARELLLLSVEVEVGQDAVHPILRIEPIAVAFVDDPHTPPDILAMRPDFPEVPHLNVRPPGHPRSLCLTDQPYAEVRLRWTAARLVESIRLWLQLTAAGVLHQADQPLEPLLGGAEARIVLPADLFDGEKTNQPLFCTARAVAGEPLQPLMVIARSEPDPTSDPSKQAFRAIGLTVNGSFTHGVIRWQPQTLNELHDILAQVSFDLQGTLRERVRGWVSDADLLNSRPIFVIAVNKRRTENGPVEASETWAFVTNNCLGSVGEELGVLGKVDGKWAPLIGGDSSKNGQAVRLELMLPYWQLSRDKVAVLNGHPSRFGGKVACVGVGALGSQVFANLSRAAWGEWTLIDSDILLPHNLARHALHAPAVGYPKVVGMTVEANGLVGGEPVARGIVADVLDPGERKDEIAQAFGEAEIIVDMSASVAVARHLALSFSDASARRVSLFLNPSGSDLVLLAEDAGRRYQLDALEMQYYRALARIPRLNRHLTGPDGKVRYGRSCRDTSVLLSQEEVALCAAIGSRAIRRAQVEPALPAIRIWQSAPLDLGVSCVDVAPTPVVELQVGPWRVITDEEVLYKVRSFRRARLPNETGGVLVGSFDMEHKRVYIADALPSPPDSLEEPTLYIRGYQGLADEVRRMRSVTAERLEYVGEWHSHPPGYAATYSNDDRKLFRWLAEEMAIEGYPPVMLIVGETDYTPYVETLEATPLLIIKGTDDGKTV